MPDNCDLDRVIIRQFTAVDSSGLTARCSQTIYINQTDVFEITDTGSRCSIWPSHYDDVDWPCNLEVPSCSMGIDPEELDNNDNVNPITGESLSVDARPVVTHHPCAQLLIDHEDNEILDGEGNCVKILRTWTIIDWCQFDSDLSNPYNPDLPFGMWNYIQQIIINPTLANGVISGTIKTFYNDPVMDHNVMMFESDHIDMNNPMAVTHTIVDGTYSFTGLDESGMYELMPYNNEGPTNGVSTLDLIGIMRHIMGMEPFDYPHLFIAGDADNNQVVNVLDVVHIQEVILGLREGFNNNTSWRYVAHPDLLNLNDPFDFDEVMDIDNFEDDINFRAIKIGDVNGSADNQVQRISERSGGVKLFINPAKVKTSNNVIEVPVTAAQFNNISGFQVSLDFNVEKMKFIDIEPGALGIVDKNISTAQISAGMLSMLWFDTEGHTYSDDEILFTMKFEGEFSSELAISEGGIQAESYRSNEAYGLDLSIGSLSDLSFTLYQNKPNPFNNTTTIAFDLVRDAAVSILVYDINGKVVLREDYQLKKGRNEHLFKSTELGGVGIYYYQIITSDQSATKKMILIN